MSISSQLPPIPLALASASLRALAQAAGQTVEARVLAQSNNGTTQVQIGRQVLSLNLPQSQPVGATLTLSVQQADGQLRLTLEAVRPPPGNAPVPSSGATQNAPATQIQLSASALAGPGAASGAVATGTTASATAAPAVTPGRVAPTQAPFQSAVAAPYGGGATGKPVVPPPGGGGLAPPLATATLSAGVPRPSAGPQVMPPTPLAAGQPQATAPVVVAPGVGDAGATVPAAPQAGPPPHIAPVQQSGSSVQQIAGVAPPSPTGQAAMGAPTLPRADIPYAVAAPPATAPAQLAGVAGSASTALPPVGQAVSASVVGQHAPPPNLAGTVAPPAGQSLPAPVTTAAQAPTTPQAALAQMVQQALPRQDSIVALTSALTAAVGKFVLPEPVVKSAQQVLGVRLQVEGTQLTGAALKSAVQRSGIFQEAMLASGQGAAVTGDTKSALLGLRQSLGAWLGSQAPIAQVAGVAPPLRGQQPRVRTGDGGLPDLPEDVREAGKILLERTEAALSRMRLHQNASLPEPHAARHDAQWSLDLPIVVAGQQHLMHMQIHRDPDGDGEREEDRGWQIRFALNLSGAGEIGAQISMRARLTGIMLWAEQPNTADALAAGIEELKASLSDIGLTPGAIVIRTGAPVAPSKRTAEQSGQHLDAMR